MCAKPWEPQKGKYLFNRYDIIKKLGEGAWGIVYLAYDTKWDMHRPVAIKHLSPGIVRSNPRAIERFKDELKIIMQNLRGLPQVVMAYDFDNIDEENYFYIMDYVGGGSLRDLFKQGALPILDAIDIALDICGTLEAIHGRNVIHNDLKPDNILIPEERTKRLLMISDFGSASLKGFRGGLGTGMTGPLTLYYSSPELLKEELVDERSDLYAVGVMLYEMIVGEVPFLYEKEADWLPRVMSEPPSVPSSKRKSVSAALDGVILKTLKKYPDERYSSADEMMSALREVRKVEVQRRKEKQELYKRGGSHFKARKWQPAIECLDKVNVLDPSYKDVTELLKEARRQGDLEARYARAETSIQCAEWETAISELEEIIRIEENYRDAKALLGKAQRQYNLAELYGEAIRCERDGEWVTARDLYLEIVSTDSGYRDALGKAAEAAKQIKLEDVYRKVDEYLLAREWEEAIRVLEDILPERPEAVERLQEVKQHKEMWASYTAGMTYLHDKRWDLAIKCFEKVTCYIPTSLDKDILGTVLNLSAEEALSNVPIYVLASVGLAQAKKLRRVSIALGKKSLRNGRLKEAIARFDEVLSLDRRRPKALQKWEEAKQRLKQQIEEWPRPTGQGMLLSLPSWENIALVTVVATLVAGLAVIVAVNIARVDVPLYIQITLGITLIGLGSSLAFRFPKGEADQ